MRSLRIWLLCVVVLGVAVASIVRAQEIAPFVRTPGTAHVADSDRSVSHADSVQSVYNAYSVYSVYSVYNADSAPRMRTADSLGGRWQIDVLMPRHLLRVGTVAPFQHEASYEYVFDNRVGVRLGIGRTATEYLRPLLRRFADRQRVDSSAYAFLSERLGRDWTVRASVPWHRGWFHIGPVLAYRGVTMSGTTQELVRAFAPEREAEVEADLNDLERGQEIVRAFYEEAMIYPKTGAVSVGAIAGLRIPIHGRWGLWLEGEYGWVLSGRLRLEAGNPLSQAFVNAAILPRLDDPVGERVRGLALATLGLGLTYSFGEVERWTWLGR